MRQIFREPLVRLTVLIEMTEEQTEAVEIVEELVERLKGWSNMSDGEKYDLVKETPVLREVAFDPVFNDKTSNDDMECTCEGPNEACSECPPRENKRETCSHIYCSKSVEECNIH